jgi:hypothetical protein
MSVEALDWQPAAGANSLTVLVSHAWGAAEAWMVRAAGREMARNRAAEFRAKADPAALYVLLTEGGARIEAAKYKRFRGHRRRAEHWLGRIAQRQPTLFAHWQLLGVRPAAG